MLEELNCSGVENLVVLWPQRLFQPDQGDLQQTGQSYPVVVRYWENWLW